jgi:hypothetical protein
MIHAELRKKDGTVALVEIPKVTWPPDLVEFDRKLYMLRLDHYVEVESIAPAQEIRR